MSIDGLPVGLGRGRGRGRGRMLPTPKAGDDFTPVTATVVTEDSVDGCVDRRLKALDFGIASELPNKTVRFDLESVVTAIESNDIASVVSSPKKISSKADPTTIDDVGVTDYKIPDTLKLPLEGEVSFSVQSVIYEEKCVLVNVGAGVDPCKTILRLLENELLEKWKQENRMVFENDTLLEKAMLSAMELSDGKTMIAHQIKKGDGELLLITIDIFHILMTKLRQDFMASILYIMVPRLPLVNSKKVGVITNLREIDGQVDVVFNDPVWRGLRETIHRVQIESKIIGPPCSLVQAFFKELINGFNVQFFLAPLGDNWGQLHRVKTLGFCNDSMVAVRYLDIGKQVDLHIKNLALPMLSRYTPDLLEKTPPLAVPFCVDKIELGHLEKTKAIKMLVEGKACYVQMVDDSAETPVANVYVTNVGGTGTVSLADIFATYGTGNAPPVNNHPNPEPLKVTERNIDSLSKTWEENLNKLKKDPEFNKAGHLLCELSGKLDTGSLPGLLSSCNLEKNCKV